MRQLPANKQDSGFDEKTSEGEMNAENQIHTDPFGDAFGDAGPAGFGFVRKPNYHRARKRPLAFHDARLVGDGKQLALVLGEDVEEAVLILPVLVPIFDGDARPDSFRIGRIIVLELSELFGHRRVPLSQFLDR